MEELADDTGGSLRGRRLGHVHAAQCVDDFRLQIVRRDKAAIGIGRNMESVWYWEARECELRERHAFSPNAIKCGARIGQGKNERRHGNLQRKSSCCPSLTCQVYAVWDDPASLVVVSIAGPNSAISNSLSLDTFQNNVQRGAEHFLRCT